MVYYLLYCKYTFDKNYRSITFLNVAFRTSSHSVSFHLKRSAKLYTRFRWWMIACFVYVIPIEPNNTQHNNNKNRLRSCAKQIVLHHSVYVMLMQVPLSYYFIICFLLQTKRSEKHDLSSKVVSDMCLVRPVLYTDRVGPHPNGDKSCDIVSRIRETKKICQVVECIIRPAKNRDLC